MISWNRCKNQVLSRSRDDAFLVDTDVTARAKRGDLKQGGQEMAHDKHDTERDVEPGR